MRETTVNHFRQHLKSEVDECIAAHDVLKVSRRHGEGFVVLSESDWKAVEETLYLNRIPGMADSILQAAAEPLNQGTQLQDLDW
ncbi:MAG: type II toxin-antitoxin system Phd/YefM family antitoxin [bacterium]|nr:type II toxin-antitoxin system Phd/YefM family antitoxin [bacterium]